MFLKYSSHKETWLYAICNVLHVCVYVRCTYALLILFLIFVTAILYIYEKYHPYRIFITVFIQHFAGAIPALQFLVVKLQYYIQSGTFRPNQRSIIHRINQGWEVQCLGGRPLKVPSAWLYPLHEYHDWRTVLVSHYFHSSFVAIQIDIYIYQGVYCYTSWSSHLVFILIT